MPKEQQWKIDEEKDSKTSLYKVDDRAESKLNKYLTKLYAKACFTEGKLIIDQNTNHKRERERKGGREGGRETGWNSEGGRQGRRGREASERERERRENEKERGRGCPYEPTDGRINNQRVGPNHACSESESVSKSDAEASLSESDRRVGEGPGRPVPSGDPAR